MKRVTRVPFLQREMKNKGNYYFFLLCTIITSLLLYNLIQQKTQLKYFFFSFEIMIIFSATVA